LSGYNIQPSPETLKCIQDKYIQKVHLHQHKIPLPDFFLVQSLESAVEAGKLFGYPYMLKNRRLAYDGKGNVVVQSSDLLLEAIKKLTGLIEIGFNEVLDLYAEKIVPFKKEIAVMVVRTTNAVLCYPVVETIQKDNICHLVIAPG